MKTEKALFAAGCFWGVQYYFDQVPGVVKTTAGYTGGETKNPHYDEVATRTTGHAEAVLVEFDPQKASYTVLLKQFFRMHDPAQVGGQGPDIGPEYRSAIFYFDQAQHAAAVKIRNQTQEKLNKPIATEITPARPFYKAEELSPKVYQEDRAGCLPHTVRACSLTCTCLKK
ncbi:MAG: peptide-methionine (S)-S-oxide reductase MsrA [Candidatus Saccharimonadales bacterium]